MVFTFKIVIIDIVKMVAFFKRLVYNNLIRVASALILGYSRKDGAATLFLCKKIATAICSPIKSC